MTYIPSRASRFALSPGYGAGVNLVSSDTRVSLVLGRSLKL